MKRLSAALDYSGVVLSGVAAWAHCLFGSDRMARWLRTNPEPEPEPMA